MRVGYLVHNLNDAAVERRCRMFAAGGAQVALAGFIRDDKLSAPAALRDPLSLGRTADAALAARLVATLRPMAAPADLKRHFANADIVVARNLEQLAIAHRIVGTRPLVYECLDIHRLLSGDRMAARAIRRIESRLLQRVDLLITSSPAFMREHFAQRPLPAPHLLIENKLLDIEGDLAPNARDADAATGSDSRPVRVGWFGMLRCRRTLDVLLDLAKRGAGRIEVRISGRPSPAEVPDLEARVAAADHVTFTGPYRYDDLPQLYGQCDFAWTIDWFEEGENSAWLLPNRIYEALAFGAVPIGLADIEIGRWLARHDVGLVVENGDDAVQQLLALNADDVAVMKAAAAGIDRGAVVATRQDCVALVEALRAIRR